MNPHMSPAATTMRSFYGRQQEPTLDLTNDTGDGTGAEDGGGDANDQKAPRRFFRR